MSHHSARRAVRTGASRMGEIASCTLSHNRRSGTSCALSAAPPDVVARHSRLACHARHACHARPSRLSAIALVFLLLLPLAAASLTPRPARAADTPEQVVTRYIAATRALKWDEIADMMHPTALDEFKDMMRPIVEIDSTGEATQLLFQVNGLAAYDALAPRDAFARLMRTMTQQNPMIAEALTDANGTVIGHVAEAPDLMHVIYRMGRTSGALKGTKIEVVTLKRDGAAWRPLLAGNIEGLAEALRQQVSGE
ncbi:MAG: hypothetical protein U0527_07675 [Candidatus Eisenbacteria bacterium]